MAKRSLDQSGSETRWSLSTSLLHSQPAIFNLLAYSTSALWLLSPPSREPRLSHSKIWNSITAKLHPNLASIHLLSPVPFKSGLISLISMLKHLFLAILGFWVIGTSAMLRLPLARERPKMQPTYSTSFFQMSTPLLSSEHSIKLASMGECAVESHCSHWSINIHGGGGQMH